MQPETIKSDDSERASEHNAQTEPPGLPERRFDLESQIAASALFQTPSELLAITWKR